MSLHYPPRRNFGRRKRDRFAAAVGIGLGFCLTGLLLTTNQCDKGTVSGPTTAEATSAPVAAAPAPAPTATPTVIDDDPAKALDLACFAGAQMVATYNGQASFAEIETWDTDFDNQNPQPRPNLRTDLVAKGKTVTRTFTVCRQGDAAIKGGKESGCFWDKRGNPFTPHTPAGTKATEECRQCDSKTARWIELEERKVGEWEDYIPETYPDATEQKCFKSQRQLVIVFEQNECSKEKRELRRFYNTQQVEIPCPCVEQNPNGAKTYSTSTWSGIKEGGACQLPSPHDVIASSTQTQLQCHENGTQAWTIDYTCSNEKDSRGSDNVCHSVACPSYCFYEVSGPFKSFDCVQEGGQWENWDNVFHNNHCRVPYPGTTDRDFQLTPGQSGNGCLSKHD